MSKDIHQLVKEFEKLATDLEEEDSDFVVSVKSACYRIMDAAKTSNLTQEEQVLFLSKLAELSLKLIYGK